MIVQQAIGRALGRLAAPLTFLGSLARGARIFHPEGVVYRAEVQPLVEEGALGRLGQRLAGLALVRLSGGILPWPASGRLPDVLGVAARFRDSEDLRPELMRGDQDLLFVTARSLLTLPIAPFTTNVDDFLANVYFAILPFKLEGLGEVELRLVPETTSPPGDNRRARLAEAVAADEATLRLEVQIEGGAEGWIPVAAIHLREQLPIDQGELRFDPGTAAMGLVPHGVLQWTRPAAYAASQAGRRLARRLAGSPARGRLAVSPARGRFTGSAARRYRSASG
ncbi:MAG TPA: hypothetical protein VLS89_14505 [Candidatus Nanopelagicales bacterium]|nr:hypothetical protein [Candidatus Nanopelagicales bacterium]